MVSALVTCTIHIFAVCVAVRTVIERGVHHHQTHDAVDSELFIGALVVHSAPRVVCSRKQSVIAGCRRLVGFVSEWLKESALFELQNFVGVPNCYGRHCFWIWSCGRNGVDFPMRSVFHRISSLEVRGSCVVCCTVSVCTTGVRNND